ENVLTYVQSAKSGATPTMLSRDDAATLVQRSDFPAPTINGLATTPIVTADGQLIGTSGFHKSAGIYLRPMFKVTVPEKVTAAQVSEASDLVNRVLGDFPWVSQSDKA